MLEFPGLGVSEAGANAIDSLLARCRQAVRARGHFPTEQDEIAGQGQGSGGTVIGAARSTGRSGRTQLRPRIWQFTCGDAVVASGFLLVGDDGWSRRVVYPWVRCSFLACGDGLRGSATAVSDLSPLGDHLRC
jgi:hypothetical protein